MLKMSALFLLIKRLGTAGSIVIELQDSYTAVNRCDTIDLIALMFHS